MIVDVINIYVHVNLIVLASTRAADIEVKENEAYVAVENYRKPIRVERNKAYEITNIVPNRSRSPQA